MPGTQSDSKTCRKREKWASPWQKEGLKKDTLGPVTKTHSFLLKLVVLGYHSMPCQEKCLYSLKLGGDPVVSDFCEGNDLGNMGSLGRRMSVVERKRVPDLEETL